MEAGDIKRRFLNIFNRDVAVFSFFLLLAMLFWYLNYLSKEVEADINFPVAFVNLPSEKSISGDQPAKVNITFKGSGYAILKLRFISNRTPIVIDISKVIYKKIPGKQDGNYYLMTSGIKRNIPVFVRSGCEIVSMKPDTLYFSLEGLEQRPIADKDVIKVVGN